MIQVLFTIAIILLLVASFLFLFFGWVVVPQQNAYVIQRLGKYSRTIHAGWHILNPFFDKIAYRHNLKEQALDIPEQVCITKDNVQVGVDGIIYFQVLDPERASYGISNYLFAITQLSQTTIRSEIGKIDLDRSFEERQQINHAVVTELDKATHAWGVKVLRYEIMNIRPPHDVLSAMEQQMRAEREKRARILESEGLQIAQINKAEGEKQRVIKESEAIQTRQINEARGEAEAILAVASATAEGIKKVAESINNPGGDSAMQLKIAQEYVQQFGNLAKAGNTFVVPANLSDIGSMIALATGLNKPVQKS